jgi:hypothetical protein
VAYYQRALTVATEVVEIRHKLTAAFAQLERLEKGAAVARLGPACRPDHAPLHVALANLVSQDVDRETVRPLL